MPSHVKWHFSLSAELGQILWNSKECNGMPSCGCACAGSHRPTEASREAMWRLSFNCWHPVSYPSIQAFCLVINPWRSIKSFRSYHRHFSQCSSALYQKWFIQSRYLTMCDSDSMIFKLHGATDIQHTSCSVLSLSTKRRWKRWGLRLHVVWSKQSQRLPCWVFSGSRTFRAAGFSKSVQFRHKQPLMCKCFIYRQHIAVTVQQQCSGERLFCPFGSTQPIWFLLKAFIVLCKVE